MLRNDIPKLKFYKGQIKGEQNSSSQFDIIICKIETTQPEYLKGVSDTINIVDRKECLGVIELKKWGNPKMISKNGQIQHAYNFFKDKFPELQDLFVCLRFQDRINLIENNWENLKNDLLTDGNFCFFGRSDKKDEEWGVPWCQNKVLIEKNRKYLGEYRLLIEKIKTLPNTVQD